MEVHAVPVVQTVKVAIPFFFFYFCVTIRYFEYFVMSVNPPNWDISQDFFLNDGNRLINWKSYLFYQFLNY